VIRRPAAALEAQDVVRAAVELLHEEGLEAVSMRRVAARLGVSPVPLYSRVGNKDDLLDAVADQLLADLVPGRVAGADGADADRAPWTECVEAWVRALHDRLRAMPDSRIVLRTRRWAFVEASRPLVEALRAAGFGESEAVRACRLVMWAVIGFVTVESASLAEGRGGHRSPRPAVAARSVVPGGDPTGVDVADADALFTQHLRYLIAGLAADHASLG
jgi:AcrR family transcriptional regulator